jgi:hypothetical protein
LFNILSPKRSEFESAAGKRTIETVLDEMMEQVEYNFKQAAVYDQDETCTWTFAYIPGLQKDTEKGILEEGRLTLFK